MTFFSGYNYFVQLMKADFAVSLFSIVSHFDWTLLCKASPFIIICLQNSTYAEHFYELAVLGFSIKILTLPMHVHGLMGLELAVIRFVRNMKGAAQ